MYALSVKIRDILRPYWRWISHHYTILILVLTAILVSLLFTELFILSLFIVIGALSFLPKHISPALGFELLTLATVTAGIAFSPWAGPFVGSAGAFLSSFFINPQEPGWVLNTFLFAILGLGTVFASYTSFAVYGILATFLFDLLYVTLSCFLFSANRVYSGLYMVTHLLINSLLFLRLKSVIFALV